METSKIVQLAEQIAPESIGGTVVAQQTKLKAEIEALVERSEKDANLPRITTLREFRSYALQQQQAGNKTVQVYLAENVPITTLFPELAESGLDSLQLANTSLIYRFEGDDEDLAGAYITTEVRFDGALQEIAAVVQELTQIGEPSLHLHGYLGAILKSDDSFTVNALTLGGTFRGLGVQSPAGLQSATLSTLGLEIRVGGRNGVKDNKVQDGKNSKDIVVEKIVNWVVSYAKKKVTTRASGEDKNGKPKASSMQKAASKLGSALADYVQLRLYGSLLLAVPRQEAPLLMDFDIKNLGQVVEFNMSPNTDKKWDDAFGFDWLDLENVTLGATLDLQQIHAKQKAIEGEKIEALDCNSDRMDHEASRTKATHKRTISKASFPASINGTTKRPRTVAKSRARDQNKTTERAAKTKSLEDWKKDKDLFNELEDSDDEDNEPGPIETEKKEPPFKITVSAQWRTPLKGLPAVHVEGQLCGEDSHLSATIPHMDKQDFLALYTQSQKSTLIDSPVDISAENLKVKFSFKGLKLRGSLSISGNKCLKGMVRISASQFCATATVDSWPFKSGSSSHESLEIKSASVKLLLKKADKERGWSGLFHVGGIVKVRHTDVKALLQVVRLPSSKWGFILSGQIGKTMSLSDYEPALKGTYLDLSLKDLTLVASTIDLESSIVSKDYGGFPVARGVFLCTSFEKVPFIEERPQAVGAVNGNTQTVTEDSSKQAETSTPIRRTQPNDRCWLAIGITIPIGVSIILYLPESMKFDLPPPPGLDIQTEVKNFQLQIGLNTVGPYGAFTGRVSVVMPRTPRRNFDMTIALNAVEGSLSLVADLAIENPLGLSRRLTLGAEIGEPNIPLGIMGSWVYGSPYPTGLGLQGTLTVDKTKAYRLRFVASGSIVNSMIHLEAPSVTWDDFIALTSAVLDPQKSGILENLPPPPADISYQDVKIFASCGGRFGNETTMPGFEFKGTVLWNKRPAMLNASLDLMNGLRLQFLIPEFQVGPLKVVGQLIHENWPGQKFAGASMEVSLLKQAIILNGEIYIFDAWAKCDVHVEHKPVQTLRLNFDLQWNSLIKISVHANAGKGSHISEPGLATLDVHCVFEQDIQNQLLQCLNSINEEVGNLAQSGISSLEAKVKELENTNAIGLAGLQIIYDLKVKELEDAQKKLRERRQNIEQDRDTTFVNLQARQRDAALREENETRAASDSKNDQEGSAQRSYNEKEKSLTARKTAKESEKEAAKTERSNKATKVDTNRTNEINNLISRLRQLPGDLASSVSSIFSMSDQEIDSFLGQIKQNVNNRYNSIPSGFSYWLEAGPAWALVKSVELIIDSFNDWRNSENYIHLKEELRQADIHAASVANALDILIAEVDQSTTDAWNEYQATLRSIQRTFDNAIAQAEALVKQAQADIVSAQNRFREALEEIDTQLSNVPLKLEIETARTLLEAAKIGSSELNAKRTALNDARQVSPVAQKLVGDFLKQKGNSFVLEHAELTGKIEPWMTTVPPFLVHIKGRMGAVLFDEIFDWVPWKEGSDENKLFREIGSRVFGVLKDALVPGGK